MTPWIPFGAAVESCLVEGEAGESGLFFKFAGNGMVRVFVLIDKAAGESPLASIRFVLSQNKEDVSRFVFGSEDNGVHCDGGAGVRIREGHGAGVRSVLW